MYGTPLRFECCKIYINVEGLTHCIGSTVVTDCLIWTRTIHWEADLIHYTAEFSAEIYEIIRILCYE